MKPIHYSNLFKKHFRMRIENKSRLLEKFKIRVDIFLDDRQNRLIRDHKLKGYFEGYKSFDITGDIRVIYKEFDEFFIFTDIGTHSQLY